MSADASAGVRRLVLVVEDDPAIRSLVALTLEDEGYEVLAFEDAIEAFDALVGLEVACVLLDIGLPAMSGHEFVANYLASCSDPAPVLFMSGWPAREFPPGVVGHIRKPFTIEELLRSVEEHSG